MSTSIIISFCSVLFHWLITLFLHYRWYKRNLYSHWFLLNSLVRRQLSTSNQIYECAENAMQTKRKLYSQRKQLVECVLVTNAVRTSSSFGGHLQYFYYLFVGLSLWLSRCALPSVRWACDRPGRVQKCDPIRHKVVQGWLHYTYSTFCLNQCMRIWYAIL